MPASTKIPYNKIGDYLHHARNKLRLTQKEMAAELGISLRHYQSLEASTKEPRLSLLYKMAIVLKVHPGEILDTTYQSYKWP